MGIIELWMHASCNSMLRQAMTDQDCSLDWRLTTIQGNEEIRRRLPPLVEIGTMIGIIAIMLAVLIVIWAAGPEARAAWAA
jgi:hypothetical protein